MKPCLAPLDRLEEMETLERLEHLDKREREANAAIWDNQGNLVFQESVV